MMVLIRTLFAFLVLLSVAGCELREARPITQVDLDAVSNPTVIEKSLIDQAFQFTLRNNRLLEAHALEVGRPLSPQGIKLARSLGVRNPEKVRIVIVKKIPKTNTAERIIQATPLVNPGTVIAGLAAGYGIFLAEGYGDKIWVLAHELVHTAQFERYGMEEMTRRYLTESVVLRDRLIPLEREAINKSADVLGIDPVPYAF
ncbi:MAG: hypothetical protein AAF198_07435 [Pseudomonadota bacterium]